MSSSRPERVSQTGCLAIREVTWHIHGPEFRITGVLSRLGHADCCLARPDAVLPGTWTGGPGDSFLADPEEFETNVD
jgi:hypothetical protein